MPGHAALAAKRQHHQAQQLLRMASPSVPITRCRVKQRRGAGVTVGCVEVKPARVVHTSNCMCVCLCLGILCVPCVFWAVLLARAVVLHRGLAAVVVSRNSAAAAAAGALASVTHLVRRDVQYIHKASCQVKHLLTQQHAVVSVLVHSVRPCCAVLCFGHIAVPAPAQLSTHTYARRPTSVCAHTLCRTLCGCIGCRSD